MIKVFLSHSSVQKLFVEAVATEMGWDFAILDKFEFESGRKVVDEINNALNATSIFVLFASKESLNSEWCKLELANIRDLVDEGKCLFTAFKIDDTIDVTKDCKPWVRQYLTNFYDNPKMLARVIQRQVHEMIWDKHPELNIKQHHYVGRDEEFSKMMSMLYERMGEKCRCIVASGLRHIGRKRFLQQLMVVKMDNKLHPSYSPIDVSLRDTDSLDSMIKQLNAFVGLYTKSDLDELLKDIPNHKDIAVKLINVIVDKHELIRIEDDCCIVNKNGYIEDWFIDVIHHPVLYPKSSMFIASTCSVNPRQLREEKLLQHLQLQPMRRTDMRVLFALYSEAKKANCDEENTKKILEGFSGYPEQVFEVVDELADYGLPAVMRDLDNINKLFDNDTVKVLDEFNGDKKAYQLLILLSKFEYIGYHQLSVVFGEPELNQILEKFERYAVYECFGTNRQYLRMNRALADYIDRNRLTLSSPYKERLAQYTKELLQATDDETLNLSEELYRSKKMLADSKFNVRTELILPSVALKVIVEQYRTEDYEGVIDLANRLLYDNNRHDYESVKRSIRYWMCLSYCKLGEDYQLQLEKEIKHFKGYTKFFILGYYERNLGHYPQAQRYYEQALTMAKGPLLKHTSKAAHELVITKMKQNDYAGALERAQDNYQHDKSNVYHIEAYFRCYVRSDHPNRDILKNLIARMRSSYDANKDVIASTFEAEYTFYVDKQPNKAIEQLKHILHTKSGPCLNYTAETLQHICKVQHSMTIYHDAVKKSTGYVEDKKYVFE